jgi:hypothetical protein
VITTSAETAGPGDSVAVAGGALVDDGVAELSAARVTGNGEAGAVEFGGITVPAAVTAAGAVPDGHNRTAAMANAARPIRTNHRVERVSNLEGGGVGMITHQSPLPLSALDRGRGQGQVSAVNAY